MTHIWTAPVDTILGLGPGVNQAAAHYDKQFGPMPNDQLWGVLFVIGFFVFLAGLAGWFFMTDGKGKPRSKKPKKADGRK